jgi:hypothetical protein
LTEKAFLRELLVQAGRGAEELVKFFTNNLAKGAEENNLRSLL